MNGVAKEDIKKLNDYKISVNPPIKHKVNSNEKKNKC